MLKGKVLITGGSGFLGRGIMRTASQENWPCEFTVYSRGEELQAKAKKKYPARYVLGDVCDYNRLYLAMLGHDTVVHAAALKYIPEGEANASECIRVNIDGTRAVMDAARAANVGRVVCISTDKAPQPINTYGMTKALVERLVHETFQQQGIDTRYVACRYGNVVGSTGSVWHTWKQQAANGEYLGVTDPTMTRYFMSIEDAVRVIVAAVESPLTGIVVLPKPKAIRISTLAEGVAQHLHTKTIQVGRRPGEKTHEQMITDNERFRLSPLDDRHVLLMPSNAQFDVPREWYTLGDNLRSSEHPPAWMTPDEWQAIAEDSESV